MAFALFSSSFSPVSWLTSQEISDDVDVLTCRRARDDVAQQLDDAGFRQDDVSDAYLSVSVSLSLSLSRSRQVSE